MILVPYLLSAVGVRVSVFGEGRLCFETGRDIAFASTATLTANPAGLLADNAGHPVFPHIRLSRPTFSVSMNGTVVVFGSEAGRLMLQKKDGSLGHPGESAFGVLQVGGGAGNGGSTAPSLPFPPRDARPSPRDVEPLVIFSIRPKNEIDSDRILLGDIADLSGEPRDVRKFSRIDLGEMPILGARRTLSKWSLVAALHDAGLSETDYKIEVFPRDVTIARKGQTVDAGTILDAATAEARKTAGGVEPTPLPGPVLSPVLAPLGDLKIVAKASRDGERMTVRTSIVVDGKEVAARTLNFGAKLDGIKPGDAVRVAVACGGAAVETDAKAKTGGVVGDAIQIITTDGTVLTATVTGTGKAEVKL